MNICVIAKSTVFHKTGGMENHLESLMSALSAMGHKVALITTALPPGRSAGEALGENIRFAAGAAPGVYSRGWWRESRRLFNELDKETRFELIFSESMSGYALAGLPGRAPLYMFIHGITIDHIKSEWRQCSGPADYLKFFAVKFPEVVYYSVVCERGMFRAVDGVIAMGDKMALRVEKRTKAVFLANNGIDTEFFKPDDAAGAVFRRELGIPQTDTVFAMAGVVSRQKGFHIGLEAFSRLCGRPGDVSLLVVGGGPDLDSLRSAAGSGPLQGKIFFTGEMKRPELRRSLNCCDVFLNPSLRMEGIPTVVLEAMSCGKPVIATDAGGTTDAFKDGECGFFVKTGDIPGLSGKMEALLADRDLRAGLGRAGRALAVQKFDFNSIVRDLMERIAKHGR